MRLLEGERVQLEQAASRRVLSVVIPRRFAPSGLLLAAAQLGLFAVVAEPLHVGPRASKPGRAGLIHALRLDAGADVASGVLALETWLDRTSAAHGKVVSLSAALDANAV
jgi:hypothetical protein